MPLAPLPIDEVLPALIAAVRDRGAAVLVAPPGAGKTTRVPGALLDAGLAGAGDVVVLEPRRLATRLAANRVAFERGARIGDEVGYEVRFDRKVGAATRIRFVTEGVLTRRLLADPELRGTGAVVLDELHERHLAGDLALALLENKQVKDAQLRIEQALKLAPDDPGVRYHAALIRHAAGDKGGALLILEPVVNGPKDFPEKKEAAELLESLGKK